VSGTLKESKSGVGKEKSASDRWAADIGSVTNTKGGSDNTQIIPTVDFHYKGNKGQQSFCTL